MPDVAANDTNEVNRLNKLAYNNYRDNADQTLIYAQQALALANRLNYNNGRAEAYRLVGIGNSTLNQPDKAIHNYLIALNYFKAAKNMAGEAKVYNNIGNEYQEIDFDKALQFFDQALTLATRLNNSKLIAALNLNMGNVYYRKKQFTSAIKAYKVSERIFTELKDTADLVQSWRNEGVIYFKTQDFAEAKRLLTYAHDQAKVHDMNTIVAGVNLTLTALYAAEKNFTEAEKALNEGRSYAELTRNTKLLYDYLITAYEMEFKRQNYKAAVYYLREIYKKDSIDNRSNSSTKLTLLQEQFKQQDLQQKTLLELQRQSYNRYRFIAATIVAGLLIVVIALLVGNIKRKAETNKRLTDLNAEVNYQKDNLDRINHHLEEIIDERTKDLQDKNARLSEYSSYLSHQIRGPIATLKGLLNLEKESLLSQRECLNMMDKCVTDIDEKIIDISDMLHDSENKVL
ncbi:hypothetical protein GCM10027037_06140 [Mucilaginibacter koreensis]